ncbi:MAG: DegT/DnrJ/EryC1/StrS family aminotransferase [Acidimicrobiales bacterium]
MAETVLVGGAGFLGRHAARDLLAQGVDVRIIDRAPPPKALLGQVTFDQVDLLVDDLTGLLAEADPTAEIVVLVGNGDSQSNEPWRLALDNGLTVARLAPTLAGRRVVLVSSVEVYGAAPGPLTEETAPRLPWSDHQVGLWAARAQALAMLGPCPPHRVAALCRELIEADPTGRWCYALTKRAQEIMVGRAVGEARLTILRLANAVGEGQERVVSRLVRRASTGQPLVVTENATRSFLPITMVGRLLTAPLGPGVYNVGSPPISLAELAGHVLAHQASTSEVHTGPALGRDPAPLGRSRLADLGLAVSPVAAWLDETLDAIIDDTGPVFDPPLPVVHPGRPDRPDVVAERQQEALWTGVVKHGNRWSRALEEELSIQLELGDDRKVLVTTSGTDALRIGIGATVGRAAIGEVALLPSFTFPATAEVLVQLGYRIRFVDVDEHTWTLDPNALDRALCLEPWARLVVTVDTFGHPSRYASLQRVCDARGVVLLADSAASLGATVDGHPVSGQAVVHAFSMSFAKIVSAGGAGGALTLPADVELDDVHGWTRSALMNEAHAVVALDQLCVMGRLIERRRAMVERYQQACTEVGLGFQVVDTNVAPSWVHFVVRTPQGADRRRLACQLNRLGVATRSYFEPLHQQGFGPLDPGCADRLPVTEKLGREVLAIPLSSELSAEQVERVTVALARAVADTHGDRSAAFASSGRWPHG